MVFSSLTFLFYFLPAALILYALTPKKLKNFTLLVISLVFYAWGDARYVIIMLASVLAGYVFALLCERARSSIMRRVWLGCAVAVTLGFLIYFKYADFFIENFAAVTGLSIPLLGVTLPIGISFYTFQILSYVIDVYRGTPAQKNPISLAAYISLFPQLIAGPIVRYSDIAEQMHERSHSFEKTAEGIRRFVLGLSKKVLIANVLGELCSIYVASGEKSVLFAWLYAIAYALQIYFDFSGYSDMAIGLGRMFGFEFLENFNIPYISQSIQEFWRRWHISLSTWFKQYLYIPLGGNRKGRIRTYVNLCIVFFATGLWHGASYTFILWGMFHGFFQVMERLFLGKWLKKNPIKLINHVYTLLVVLIGWVFFRAETLAYAFDYLQVMFTMQKSTIWSCMELVDRKAIIIAAAGLLLCGPIQKTPIFVWLKTKKDTHVGFAAVGISVVLIMVYSILSLVSGAYNPFIYFRF